MSVTEILAELPKLDSAELDLIYGRVLELQRETTFVPSPKLSRAIDEADSDPEADDISIEEALRRAKSWNTK